MPKPKVLLINPPIYDFAAYDFWMKPYGMLRFAGMIRNGAELHLFDFLDRTKMDTRSDSYGRGKFQEKRVEKPEIYSGIKRYYKRFGLAREDFIKYLSNFRNLDYILINTTMTYWYPGYMETIQTVREIHPGSTIVLGGVYATLLEEHAKCLGADFVVDGDRYDRLLEIMGITPDLKAPPAWELYDGLEYGVIKLTEGCPFRCTYCASKIFYPDFHPLDFHGALEQLDYFSEKGVRNIVFYDDSLLNRADEILLPFLDRVIEKFGPDFFSFHTPNALNARFLTRHVASSMTQAGFKTFFLGFESSLEGWQKNTGGKVSNTELVNAVENLQRAGVPNSAITVYLMVGHPGQTEEEVEESIEFIKGLGTRIMLSEFSPIPGTSDFLKAVEKAGIDPNEPLCQNNSYYPLKLWGEGRIHRIKSLLH